MDEINTGIFGQFDDVNIIANLIKIFFRNLPQSLFSFISEKIIYQVSEGNLEFADKELKSISEPWRSLIYWLLDLMV